MSKTDLVNRYYKKRRINNDIYSDTYRGGMDDYLYKAYSFQNIKDKWIDYVDKNKEESIDFYLHIPFCFTLCKYCDYYKVLVKQDSIDKYLNYIYWYLGEFKKVFKGKKFRSMYIGGGSPSLLSSNQIDSLLSYIFKNFKFEEDSEITFEVNPINITMQKAKILSKYPINRISMGIQSIDPKVLDKSNRGYQKENTIDNAVNILKSYGFKDINGDVIMGLKEDTVDSLDMTINKMVSLGFSSIVLYWLLPTDEYLGEHFNGKLDQFYDNILPRIKLYYNHIKNNVLKKYNFDYVNLKEENGYRWDLVIKNSNVVKYDDFSEASLFGVGSSSRSHIFGEFYYKTIDFIDFESDSKSIKYMGREIMIEDEESLYNITSLTNKEEINIEKYNKLFKNDFSKKNKELINILEDKNLIKIDGIFLKSYISFKEKNYFALYFLTDEELIKRIDFLENNIWLKLILKNGLNLGIKLIFEKEKINFIIYNYYSVKNNNISFYYDFNIQLDLILSKTNKFYLSGLGEEYCKKFALKIILKRYKDFILKINNN